MEETCIYAIGVPALFAQSILLYLKALMLRRRFSFALLVTGKFSISHPALTNVCHICSDTNTSALEAVEYVFTHPKWRPWGHRLPMTCPVCGTPNCWTEAGKHFSTYIFTCRHLGCEAHCEFSRPQGFNLCEEESNGGRWLEKKLML